MLHHTAAYTEEVGDGLLDQFLDNILQHRFELGQQQSWETRVAWGRSLSLPFAFTTSFGGGCCTRSWMTCLSNPDSEEANLPCDNLRNAQPFNVRAEAELVILQGVQFMSRIFLLLNVVGNGSFDLPLIEHLLPGGATQFPIVINTGGTAFVTASVVLLQVIEVFQLLTQGRQQVRLVRHTLLVPHLFGPPALAQWRSEAQTDRCHRLCRGATPAAALCPPFTL